MKNFLLFLINFLFKFLYHLFKPAFHSHHTSCHRNQQHSFNVCVSFTISDYLSYKTMSTIERLEFKYDLLKKRRKKTF